MEKRSRMEGCMTHMLLGKDRESWICLDYTDVSGVFRAVHWSALICTDVICTDVICTDVVCTDLH